MTEELAKLLSIVRGGVVEQTVKNQLVDLFKALGLTADGAGKRRKATRTLTEKLGNPPSAWELVDAFKDSHDGEAPTADQLAGLIRVPKGDSTANRFTWAEGLLRVIKG